jgi:hypothetical protein
MSSAARLALDVSNIRGGNLGVLGAEHRGPEREGENDEGEKK